jgi:hypothetical protein
MQAPVTHILPLTSVRRERLLPVPGKVFARLEQKVAPLDVVAEAKFGQEHVLLDVARTLRVSPEETKAMIRCKAGETVTKGQVIAQSKSLIPQTVRAPSPGRVLLIGGGQVLLETGETTIELQAGVPGSVTRVIPERGIEITFSGALVQGVWGNGRVDTGMLLPLLAAPADVLTSRQMDVSQRGSVILAGYCTELAALETAAELPVRGMILGGLSPALLPQAATMSFPIVVIDGFAHRPMNGTAFKLLITNAKRDVTLNGETYDRYSGARPEIFIPLPVTQEPPSTREVETFAPNQPVRLIRDPHAGEVGTLLNLRSGLTAMPSGLRILAGEVKLDSGEQVIVPLANLEVLG